MLALLANKEITIEALKRELADKKSAAEKQVQREGKLKGQIKKLKAMLKPLGDELVFQRSELGRVKSEAELRKSEVEARQEELVDIKEELEEKCRLVEQQKEDLATFVTKLNEMERIKEALDVEKGKFVAMEKKLKSEQGEALKKADMLENMLVKVEEDRSQLEEEKLQAESVTAATERRAHEWENVAKELEDKLHHSEKRAAALSEELKDETHWAAQLKKVEEELVKFEEMLSSVKLECAEVKRENKTLEESLKNRQTEVKNLKRKLSQASKSAKKRQLEEEEGGKKEKSKQGHDESLAKRANCVQLNDLEVKKELIVFEEMLNVNPARKLWGEDYVAATATAEQQQDVDVVVNISDDVVNISDDEEQSCPEAQSEHLLSGSEEFEGTVLLTDPPILNQSNGSIPGVSTSATLSPSSSCPLDVSGSPPLLQTHDIPPSSKHGLRLRDVNALVESPSQGASTESQKFKVEELVKPESSAERVVSLKHEMKREVELALRKFFHRAQRHVQGLNCWEIFEDEDFAEVCRMLSVQAREEVLKRWGTQSHDYLQEDLWILEEDLTRMRGNVDQFFYIRKV